MRMVARFEVPAPESESWLQAAELALAAFSRQKGFIAGEVSAAIENDSLWLLTCQWESVGDYRRALSAFEVKRDATALLYQALNEPTAFEPLRQVIEGEVQSFESAKAADADIVRVREAASANPPKRLG